jgi:drug/metabolite transporter (DMT)-like permease
MAARGAEGIRRKAGPVAGLLLLCLLWSLDSLRADLLPSLHLDQRQTWVQALAFAMAALTAVSLSLMRRAPRLGAREAMQAALIGVGMFVAPAMLIQMAGSWVTDSTRVALFSLTPVVAVVFEPYLGRANARQTRGALIGALVAVAGTLCVFPVDVPRSINGGAACCAVVAAAVCIGITNCWAVRAVYALQAGALAPFAAIATGTAALFFAVVGAMADRRVEGLGSLLPTLGWTAAVDLPALLLLLWLMRRMTATPMTTRFLIAPLMANLIALALYQPTVNLRAGLGLVAIAAGAGWIVFAQESQPETGSSLLNLDQS